VEPRHASTDNAARTRSTSSTPRIDVIVLSTDAVLLATLREASQPIHNLLHAATPETAVDLLIGSHWGILIIDLAVVRDAPAELIDKLHAQFPDVLLLATGRREEQQQVIGLVGSGRIYRFLHKPVSPARAELFLSAATRRRDESYRQIKRLPAARSFRTRHHALIGVVALIAVAGGWLWSHTAHEPASPPTANANGDLEALLARADAALATGNLTAPNGEGALELYRAALAAANDNERARRGMDEVVARLERNTREALAARDAPRASDAFTALQKARPDHPQLAELQNNLLALLRRAPEIPPRSATEKSGAAPEANTHRIASPNLDLARAFLNAGQLIEPSDASALNSLRAARDANEDEPSLKLVATDLGTRLAHQALVALEVDNIDGARSAYRAAAEVDREFETALPDVELVASKLREAEGARAAAALAELVARASLLRRQGRLTEPGGANAVEALQDAAAMDANADIVREEQRQLSFALLENARTALATGDIDRADVFATRTEEVLPGLPHTRALREQIGAARLQRDESTVLQAAGLPRTKQVPAVYPREALLNGIEGWVDLEFTISPEGIPTEISVKASKPPRIFDTAAMQALRQWRFEPILRNGEPRARRAALRMQFKLEP
jgi:TonB family protein